MKKSLLLFICLLTISSIVKASDDKPIKINQLPESARQFIKMHFAESKVAIARMESDWFDKNFDVIFTDGNKLEFDKQGNWKEVNCKYSAVPFSVLPSSIHKYVSENYPGVKVINIERDKKYYEVKLSNKWELKFDLQFNVIEIDN